MVYVKYVIREMFKKTYVIRDLNENRLVIRDRDPPLPPCEYANWFMTQGVINDCIFIDKCGYNIWTARSYGRARVGERAYRQVSGQRGKNVTICLAVSPTNGLVYHTARIGGMNRQLFNDLLGEVGRRVNPDNQTFLVFDNAPAYRNADCPRGRIKIKMLPPPHSPFLNIVEQAISALKAAIQKPTFHALTFKQQ